MELDSLHGLQIFLGLRIFLASVSSDIRELHYRTHYHLLCFKMSPAFMIIYGHIFLDLTCFNSVDCSYIVIVLHCFVHLYFVLAMVMYCSYLHVHCM